MTKVQLAERYAALCDEIDHLGQAQTNLVRIAGERAEERRKLVGEIHKAFTRGAAFVYIDARGDKKMLFLTAFGDIHTGEVK